ncbi:SDR family oxidoreductase [Arenibaculum pallidiluteum]|uniref:SDR family oxidoreductase n=1 Tax=Arenibaculum pallidiluteum TaxID=2812559 RepID=UPI001F22C22B|nr:SDR family oxidoreductase [Arenibaculum pallidiluteum]
MPVDLGGRVIIVTGATQGVGEAVARNAAACGAAGLVICGRDEGRGRAVAADLEAQGCRTVFQRAELERPDDCRAVVAAADRRFGRVDGLVNAAGATDRGHLEDTTVELWDRLFAVNVRAPFLLIQESAALMRREGIAGSIVNVITMSSHGGQPFLVAYSASKGALATLTKNTANGLRRHRIRVNGINMGWCDTPNEDRVQREAMGRGPSWLAEAEADQPFGRLVKPADVARLAAFLLSDESGIMTGALIDHDQNVMGAYD